MLKKPQPAHKENHKDPTNIHSRIQFLLAMGQNLTDRKKCGGLEDHGKKGQESIAEQLELLTQRISERSMEIGEAKKQGTSIAAVKDPDFWLEEVESIPTTVDMGKYLALVQDLMKKHQLAEADLVTHEDHTKDSDEQAESQAEFGHPDSADIKDKKNNISVTYKHTQYLAAH